MTKSSATYTVNYSASATTYRNFMGVISAQINAVMPKTSDTGQVDFATVSTGGSSSTRDYEVFAFSDSLQATKPIFLRVDYQSGPSTNTAQVLGVTVGTATNGAGTVTGVTSTGNLFALTMTGSAQSNTNVYACANGEQFILFTNMLNPAQTDKADAAGAIVVERTRDADGTANGDGFMVYRWYATQLPNGLNFGFTTYRETHARIYDTNAAQPASTYDLGAVPVNLANAGSYINGSQVSAFPVYGFNATNTLGASKALMLGVPGDFAKMQPVTVNHYGQSMQFLPLGPTSIVNAPHMSGPATAAVKPLTPLIRWE